jgi:hypothetical protein
MHLLGLLAIAVIFLVVVWDWKRGKTGFGRLVLTRELSPARYWFALVAYLNMAFLLFWLFQYLDDRRSPCDPDQSNCIILLVEEPK